MPKKNEKPDPSLYEVLGVPRSARLPEIVRAYERLKADEEKESTVPDPRRMALARVAHDTLTDPDRRAAYDKSLGLLGKPKPPPAPVKRKRGATGPIAGVALVVLAAAGAAWYFLGRDTSPAAKKAEAPGLAPAQVVEEVAQHVGRVQGALMSGEVRELGAAVGIASGEMVTTCRGIEPGMQLSVKVGEIATKAEVARASTDLDVCTLAVPGAGSGVKLRPGVPALNEKLNAITVASARPGVLGVTTARAIQNPAGPVLEIKAGAPLPNGTPLFDAQARLVGIVVAPHAFGEGVVAALGAARIAQSRAAAVAAAPATPAGSPATPGAPAAAPGAPEDKPVAPAPASAPHGQGTMVAEGFATLWRESDDNLYLTEVLDNVTKGQVGVPHAYWTKWTGRDASRPHVVHCLVTFGPDEMVIADYDQDATDHPANGYWYCAITRWQVELDRLPVGNYTFTIFVDGRQVAQNTLFIEKRFFTRGTWAVIVVVAGLGLLAWLRRGKRVTTYGH
jgi:hypothetical protein